ncbi:hypothetical protein Fmac_031275 [Flemingia macrophylla]|uniref:Uncharacterized protein n=1 Tax=Flemingia macrophylla TaxID=520843 RepID=A0ABD1L1K7_9FABA
MKILSFLQFLFCLALLLINPSVAPNAPAPPSSGDLDPPERRPLAPRKVSVSRP